MKRSSETVATEKSLKSVVRSAFEDEDRSKNLIIFGLTEQDGEKLDRKVIGMLSDLNEKPLGQPAELESKGTTSQQATLIVGR